MFSVLFITAQKKREMLHGGSRAAGAAGAAAAACGNRTDERKLVHQLPVMPLIGWTRNLAAICLLFLLPRFKMQPRFPGDYSTQPEASPTIRVLIRSSRGSGARIRDVEVCATGTIANVKQLLCLPPHSICSDASMLVLVLKGKCTSIALAFITYHYVCSLHVTLFVYLDCRPHPC
jgi:hypothetical protein